ncbi:hypothetical protein EV360DRAFT_46026 [Lentinula raphanica]|nr:hypothetical protein EV360DRAFT_46026 [Lentinula raphanica]
MSFYQSDVIELSDSDTPATPPPSSQAYIISDEEEDLLISSPVQGLPRPSLNKGKARDVSDYDTSGYDTHICLDGSDDDDLPDARDILGGLNLPFRSSTSFGPSTSFKRPISPSAGWSDSDETPSPPKKSRVDIDVASTIAKTKQTKRKGKTAEEKAREKELREQARAMKNAEKERQKQQKMTEKAAQKAMKEAQKQQDREEKASHRKANQLLLDKKVALQYMTIILSESFKTSLPAFAGLLHTKVDGFKTIVRDNGQNLLPGYDTVRWQRSIYKEYDIPDRAFKTVKPVYQKYEKFALLRLDVARLRELVRKNGLGELVERFRETHELERKDIMFIMVFGMGKLRKRKVAEWNELESALIGLQFQEDIHLAYVESEQEAVDRIYNYSGDLGELVRPYKLISRSYLPFCPDTNVKSGKGHKDTWTKMLNQVHRLTEHGAKGIAERYPTMQSLLMAYESTDTRACELLLSDCRVERRRDGQKTSERGGHDKLGPALSRRVHTIFAGTDHLSLVFNDK